MDTTRILLFNIGSLTSSRKTCHVKEFCNIAFKMCDVKNKIDITLYFRQMLNIYFDFLYERRGTE